MNKPGRVIKAHRVGPIHAGGFPPQVQRFEFDETVTITKGDEVIVVYDLINWVVEVRHVEVKPRGPGNE